MLVESKVPICGANISIARQGSSDKSTGNEVISSI